MIVVMIKYMYKESVLGTLSILHMLAITVIIIIAAFSKIYFNIPLIQSFLEYY